MKRILLISAVMVAGFFSPGWADHQEYPVPRILLLHSYHQGFAWSDELTLGIREQLDEHYQNVDLDIQYLDEKRVTGSQLWPQMQQILLYKYTSRKPDVILAIDDAALLFLLNHHDSLFPDVPVVFGGLSHFDPDWTSLRMEMTGLLEKMEIRETVEVARRLHPDLEKVVVVNDATITGVQRHIQGVLELEPLFGELQTEHWVDLTIAELRERLGLLDERSMVLFVSFFRDAKGEVFSGEEVVRLADENTAAPIYTTHGPMIGPFTVGGLVNRGREHGREVARLAHHVLDGEDPATIPIVYGPTTPIFDDRQLSGYNIDRALLPNGSQVINVPPSLVSRYPRLVELSVFILFLLVVVQVASFLMIRIKRRATRALEQNYAMLQAIVENIPDPIFYKDKLGRYLGGNRAFCVAMGLKQAEILGRTVAEIFQTELAQGYHRSDLDLLERGGRESYEAQVRFADGSLHDILFHKAVFSDESSRPLGMVAAMIDITGRKRIEAALKSSQERFRTLFETSPDPIILSDIEGKILDVNAGFEEQSGISRVEAIGKTSFELGLWPNPQDRERMLSELKNSGSINNLQFELSTRKGVRTALFSARVISLGGVPHMIFTVRDITRLNRAEKELEQSELRLRTVFDASPDAILISRAGGGGIVDVNQGFTTLWGYEKEEVLWRGTIEMNLWADLQQRGRLVELLELNGKVDDFEIRIRCKGGEEKTCSISARRIELDGHLTTLAVLRDVSGQIAAKKALFESEQKFHAAFQQTFQMMGILDRQGRVIEINQNALSMFDLAIEEVRGKDFWDTPWWREEGQREMIQLGVETAARGNLFQVRNTHTLADGSKRHIDFSINPVRNEAGEIIYLIPEGRDITGLYIAEQALRVSEGRYRGITEQFQSALNGVPDVMLIFDPKGKLVWGNQSAARAFGFSDADVGKKNCRQVWGEKAKCEVCVDETFVQGKPWEDIIETRGGFSWGVKTFPIVDDTGTVINVFQVATDLTEKLRLQEQASRASHLAALGEVAAGVAHEINNPVGLLLIDLPLLRDIYADLLALLEQQREEGSSAEYGGLPVERVLEEVPPIFEELTEGALRIKTIVEELKDFASPHVHGKENRVNLNEIIDKALLLTRKTVKASGVELQVSTAEDLPDISGNAQRLEQVLVNLLLNALQAVEGVGQYVEISTEYHPGRNFVVLKVRDDGRGIPEDKLSLITDPFFTTRREAGGTGLGLSVTSRIVDEHQGVLSFSSRPGEGTTVVVELPVREGKE